MGCDSTVGRFVLIVINQVVLLVSMALIAAGTILKYFVDKILPHLGDLDAVGSLLKSQLHIPSVDKVTQLPLVQEAGTTLLALGCVLFLVSFCACCGARYQSRPLLIVFAIVMVVMVIVQAVVGGLFLTKDSVLHKRIRDNVAEQMKAEYKETGDSVITFTVNIMNYLLGCCGITGWQDFNQSKPVMSCCKSSVMTDSTNQSKCLTPTQPYGDTFNKIGCYEKLQDTFMSQVPVTAVVLALILGLQVAEIVITILIVK